MTKAEFEAAWSAMSDGERRDVLREFIHELSADYGLRAPDVQFGITYDKDGNETCSNYRGTEAGFPLIVINDRFVLPGGNEQISDPWNSFDSAAHEFAHHGRGELGNSYEWGSGAHINKDGWPSIEHFAWVETQKVLDEIERGERFPYMSLGDTGSPYVHSTYWEHLEGRLAKEGWGGAPTPRFLIDHAEGPFGGHADSFHRDAAARAMDAERLFDQQSRVQESGRDMVQDAERHGRDAQVDNRFIQEMQAQQQWQNRPDQN